jgi:hypothetical protein
MRATFKFNGESVTYNFTENSTLVFMKGALYEEKRDQWFRGIELHRIALKEGGRKAYSPDKAGPSDRSFDMVILGIYKLIVQTHTHISSRVISPP